MYTGKFKRGLGFLLMIGVLLAGGSCRDKGEPASLHATQGMPNLELVLSHVDLRNREILFVLTVTNGGPGSLTIPHLQEGRLEWRLHKPV